MDSELADFYDLVLVGTGMVESMLSCAAARAGKKVLHMDPNDFYGSQNASFSLSGILREFKRSDINETKHLLICNDFDAPESHLQAFSSISRWSDNSGKVHPSFLSLASTHNIHGCQQLHPAWLNVGDNFDSLLECLKNDKDFNIDLSCSLLMGSGKFIESLIDSGVSNYLDFCACQGVFMFTANNVASEIPGWKLPLSKNDIFLSNKLSAVEKRSLMKFQQYVTDNARQQVGTDVLRLNEIELAKGRSLHRPQNKSETMVLNKSDNFVELMNSFKLSSTLQALLTFVLCLYTGSDNRQLDSNTSMKSINLFLEALGKYGGTSFLFPMYGICEILQGFCRMSAVWGSTFVLRRNVLKFEATVEDCKVSVQETSGNEFRCDHFIVNLNCLPLSNLIVQSNYLLRSIFVYDKRILDQERSVATIPPFFSYNDQSGKVELNNTHPIFLIENDSSTSCCPTGTFVMHMCTIFSGSTISVSISGASWKESGNLCSADANDLVRRVVSLLAYQRGEEIISLRKISYLLPIYDEEQPNIPKHPHIHYAGHNNSQYFNLETEFLVAEKLWTCMYQTPLRMSPDVGELTEKTVDCEDEESKEYSELFNMIKG